MRREGKIGESRRNRREREREREVTRKKMKFGEREESAQETKMEEDVRK